MSKKTNTGQRLEHASKGGGPLLREPVDDPKEDPRVNAMRRLLWSASLPGRFARLEARIKQLKNAPQSMLEDLDVVGRLLHHSTDVERNAEVERNAVDRAREALKDLHQKYRAEITHRAASARTAGRLDRVQSQEFMAWAKGIDPKTARNIHEVTVIPGFQASWLNKYEPTTIKRWAKQAGFEFQNGRPRKA